jgi:hypothetical protein
MLCCALPLLMSGSTKMSHEVMQSSPWRVAFAESVTGECERKVQSNASNEHLQVQGYKMGLQGVVHNNPCQGGEVPRTAMASTMEAVIGAAWW